MIVISLYLVTLIANVAMCKGDSVKSVNDYLPDNDLTPVINYKGNDEIRGWPMSFYEKLNGNSDQDDATTKKASLWMSGQGGATVQTGNSKEGKSDKTKQESSPGEMTTEMEPLRGQVLNLFLRPRANSVKHTKTKGYGFGLKRFETLKMSNSDFNVLSGWDTSYNNYKIQSKKWNSEPQYPVDKDNMGSTRSSSQDDHNDGSTVRVDSGVQPNGKKNSEKISSKRVARQVIPLKLSNNKEIRIVIDTSTKLPQTSDTTASNKMIPLTGSPSIIQRAHHFIQRWMMWKDVKSESMLFSEA